MKEFQVEDAALWLYRRLGGYISFTDAIGIVRRIRCGEFGNE